MGGIILMIAWILLIILVIVCGVDCSCRIFLKKVIVDYDDELKSAIVGYNIYRYLKWKKEI